jgi:hypothetical protein
MKIEYYFFIALLVIAAAFLIRWVQAAAHAWRYHGLMLVTCPETRKPAAVRAATFRAALSEFLNNKGQIRLSACSRWPERRNCSQDCVCQIEQDPKDHRVWNIASQWFTGKKCVYCHKPIDPLSDLDDAPALMRIPDCKTVEWKDLPAEQLPAAFSECVPVCWSCHITETLIREHPERVTFRRWERSGPIGEYAPKNLDQQNPASKPVA